MSEKEDVESEEVGNGKDEPRKGRFCELKHPPPPGSPFSGVGKCNPARLKLFLEMTGNVEIIQRQAKDFQKLVMDYHRGRGRRGR